ncbi:hypothetical protein HPB50_023628 [Hyalomma asiaticum]|uniref:Uncharacterized protein n=1 Tax=Hyalomma asiaticum TaxID=266040 RepID=A0ACB7T2T1_HYAAI|nr:hypothetical protein HPB50_023628 [Hyalomma asiaticum]
MGSLLNSISAAQERTPATKHTEHSTFQAPPSRASLSTWYKAFLEFSFRHRHDRREDESNGTKARESLFQLSIIGAHFETFVRSCARVRPVEVVAVTLYDAFDGQQQQAPAAPKSASAPATPQGGAASQQVLRDKPSALVRGNGLNAPTQSAPCTPPANTASNQATTSADMAQLKEPKDCEYDDGLGNLPEWTRVLRPCATSRIFLRETGSAGAALCKAVTSDLSNAELERAL